MTARQPRISLMVYAFARPQCRPPDQSSNVMYISRRAQRARLAISTYWMGSKRPEYASSARHLPRLVLVDGAICYCDLA